LNTLSIDRRHESLSMWILWDTQKPCTCAHALVTKYQKRISGPLLDRIDIQIEVPRVDYEKLSGDRAGEPSECIRARVQAARDKQTKRFSSNGSSDIVCNADMRVGEISQFCKLPEDAQSLMRTAMSQLNLSARAYHRILKLARTIADLAGCEEIQSAHLAEALHASQSSEVDDELATDHQVVFYVLAIFYVYPIHIPARA
jgi:magnesium chelatase family protein